MEGLRKWRLREGHPLIGDECEACHVRFVHGNWITLISLGPGGDEGERQRARDGAPYTGVAAPVHWACATGEEVVG